MDLMRRLVERSYDTFKPFIFRATEHDPEVAHEKFIVLSQHLSNLGLDKLLLDTNANEIKLPFELSNAAGLNKNGDIPPSFLKYLGFTRNVVGTVTFDEYEGNERPRIRRYPRKSSLVNWMGLPGFGAKRVAEILASYGPMSIPLTINFMATPGKTGDELLRDLEGTIRETKRYTNRFELNISCPNTHASDANESDSRKEYQRQLADMLTLLNNEIPDDIQIYVKLSPDLDADDFNDTFDVMFDHRVDGITGVNTTSEHDIVYIFESPGKGGASGRAVRKKSQQIQNSFRELMRDKQRELSYIACGGIGTLRELKACLDDDYTHGIQLFTPLIFNGPKYVREIREEFRYPN